MDSNRLFEDGWIGVKDCSLEMVARIINSGRLTQCVDEDDRQVMQYLNDDGEWQDMAERKFDDDYEMKQLRSLR